MIGSSDGEERTGLLEKLVIVAIVVFLAAITAVMMSRLENVKRLARARAECKSWAIAVTAYRCKYGGVYPSNLATLTEAQADGAPPFMLAKSLYDPWGREYQYAPPSDGRIQSLRVSSLGPRPNDPNSVIQERPVSRP